VGNKSQQFNLFETPCSTAEEHFGDVEILQTVKLVNGTFVKKNF